VVLIACYFFLFQKRLQRKVVSDYGWITFLGKGEGATRFQNNLSIKSGFEQVLADIAGLNAISDGGSRDIMENVKQMCLLMKECVDVYGQGRRENAKDQGLNEVLGQVHKLLAKDVMHWNNAWGDDAFADGKISS